MRALDYRRHWPHIVLVLVVFVVNGAYSLYAQHAPAIGPDFDRQYSLIAEHIVRDGVYSRGERDATGQLQQTATLPPLFVLLYTASFVLFGFGGAAHEAIRILFVLANIGTILVSWRIGTLFSRRAGYFTVAIAVLDVTALYFTQNYGIPDSLFGFWMALMVFYLTKVFLGEASYRNVFFGSLFLGLGMWTKVAPYMLWVPIAALLIPFLWRHRAVSRDRKVRIFSIFAVMMTLFFGGWKLRNYFAIGYGNFTTVGATAYRWNASHLIARQEGISREEASDALVRRYVKEDVLRLDEGARNRYLSSVYMPFLLRSPITFSYVTLRALPGFFLGTFPPHLFSTGEEARAFQERVEDARGYRALLPQLWSEGHSRYVAIYVAAKTHLLVLYSAVLIGAIVLFRRSRERFVLVFFSLVVAYLVVVSGAAAQARYRTMIMPIMYALGGVGIAYVWERLSARRTSSRGALRAPSISTMDTPQ